MGGCGKTWKYGRQSSRSIPARQIKDGRRAEVSTGHLLAAWSRANLSGRPWRMGRRRRSKRRRNKRRRIKRRKKRKKKRKMRGRREEEEERGGGVGRRRRRQR